jgi:hypothetical protein
MKRLPATSKEREVFQHVEQTRREMEAALDSLWDEYKRGAIPEVHWHWIKELARNIEIHTEKRVRTGVGRTFAEIVGVSGPPPEEDSIMELIATLERVHAAKDFDTVARCKSRSYVDWKETT